MTNKKIKVLVSLFIMGIIMSGCKSNKHPASETNENTKINTKAEDNKDNTETEVNTKITSEDDNKESEDISEEEKISEKVDFSYLSDAVTKITIYGTGQDVLEKGNKKEINDDAYDLKLVNTSGGYNLEINTLSYSLGIDDTSYREFIKRAVGTQYYTNKDNDRIYELTNDTILECRGEKFMLVSYIQDDMGRGNCELLGEDGETYKILNDMSFIMDPFIGAPYFEIVSNEGITVTRYVSFNPEGAVLFIPSGTKLEAKFKKYVNESPDSDLGNPIGIYSVQFDSTGNIIKIEE